MFTRATKNFGVWKSDNVNMNISFGIFSRQILVALGMAAFVAWIFFIITVKIRQEFFLFESSSRSFFNFSNADKNSSDADAAFFFSERNSAFSILVLNSNEGKNIIVFDTGRAFSLPDQNKQFATYLDERKQNIMLTSMLMRIEDRAVSRIKIWADNNVSFKNINDLIKIFSEFGYDSFDLAAQR